MPSSVYLSELIQPLSDVDLRRRLRSASTAEVLVSAMRRLTIGDHALSVAGPTQQSQIVEDVIESSRLSKTLRIRH